MAMPKRDEMLKARGVVKFQCELKEVLKSVGKGVVKSVGKILKLLGEFPEITRERLAAEVGLSVSMGTRVSTRSTAAALVARRTDWETNAKWAFVKISVPPVA